MIDDAAGVDALALDGRIVRIRPVASTDAAGLAQLHRGGDERSLRSRFFSYDRASVDREVARLTRSPCDEFAAVVALDHDRMVAVASYERAMRDPEHAEVAVFVDPVQHGRGIGTLLLEHLSILARSKGVTRLTGNVHADNLSMLKVMVGLNADGISPAIGSVVDVEVPTTWTDRELQGIDRRDRLAERASLSALLNPRAVAVVGAGRETGGVGHEILHNIVKNDYKGQVYPIHPEAESVAGVKAFRSLAEAPRPIDLVIVAVPAPAVPDVIDAAGQAGVRAAVVISSGFAETGAEGMRAQAELVRRCRDHDMRLVGPNCLGIIVTDPQVSLVAGFAADVPQAGGLALVSQSGAVGIAVLHHAAHSRLGVHAFVSLGNKADVSGNDLLAYWFDDPHCKVVALYLESFGNPRKFARVARSFARNKPVLAIKSGRSIAGRRAGASHTAAAAATDTTVDALFRQAGVIRVDTLGDMVDTARTLVDQPLPGGTGVAIVGNAGGVNVLAADAVSAAGLQVRALAPETPDRLRGLAPDAVTLENPVDLGAAADPRTLGAAITALAGDREINAVVVVLAATRTNDVPGCLSAISAAADACATVPIVAVIVGAADAPSTLGERAVPVFDLPERAVAALGRAAAYAHWKRQPLGSRVELTDVDTRAARSLVDEALRAGGGWQSAEWGTRLLSTYRIPSIETSSATSVSQAVAAAKRLGFPVALKADDPKFVHKTEHHAVHLGLRNTAAIKAAYLAIGEALGTCAPRVVVQPMANGAVELLAGVVHDPLFGSVVMLGLGGVHTDVFADRSFRLLPVTDTDANGMWRSLRAAPLLTGHRGSEPIDTARVEDLVLRLARLAEDFPQIAELDLNPVIADAVTVTAVDVKVRLAPVTAEPDAESRALR